MCLKRLKRYLSGGTAPGPGGTIDQDGQQKVAERTTEKPGAGAQQTLPSPPPSGQDVLPKPGQFWMPWHRPEK